MEYKIFRAYADSYRVDEHLEKMVNEFIKKGWQPLGGISIVKSMSTAEVPFEVFIIYQAMIKE